MPKIGAHVSSAISLDLAFKRANDIGAECFQIFISPPQQWSQVQHNPEVISKFKEQAKSTGLGPNFIHATYLVNLGTDNPEHLQKSIRWLIYALKVADELSIKGVIVHPGSHKGHEFDEKLPQIKTALTQILESTNQSFLILETSAGAGYTIGDTFAELGQILKNVNNPRLKICLDTQHIFASGYNIKTREGLEKTLDEFDREVGLENLAVIHANDSKSDFNSKRDRHENIGEGVIGLESFANIINYPKLKNVPFVLEVPGAEKKGPDLKNVQTLKSLLIN